MKKENEVKTKVCPQCKGLGTVIRKHSRHGTDMPVGCPVCDGYGFVIADQPVTLKDPMK